MLFRDDVFEFLNDSEMKQIWRMFQRALEIRRDLSPFILYRTFPKELYFRPVCHEVAHAFAKVFGGTAVDGEHMFPNATYTTEAGENEGATFSTLLHSWVEFETAGGNRFILDVFPDSGGSLFPVLLRAPNPAYWIPTDKVRMTALRSIKTSRTLRKKVRLLVEAMNELRTSPEVPIKRGV